MEETYIFTFGVGQPHAGHFVKLAGTLNETREEMFRLFGDAWSFQYKYAKGMELIEEWRYIPLAVDSKMSRHREGKRS